jgi:thiol-disulfide isomerase/thioredoxin
MVRLRHIFLAFITSLSLFTNVNAQLPDGSIAPNFTITDLNGVSHNLYDVLAEDKAVVIDFFATWCTPCWVVHSSHALSNIYNKYGLDGTNEIMVFGIESDVASDVADILGTGDNTIGNWTEGNDYPFADDFRVAREYQSPGYPSLFIIRPNKRIYFASEIFPVENISPNADSLAYSAAARGANDGRLINANFTPDVTICKNESISPEVDLMNYGDSTLRSAEVSIYKNGALIETKNWTGNLETFQKSSIAFNDIIIDESSEIKYEIKNPNGETDQEAGDNIVFENYKVNALKTLDLKIMTDFWPEDISWDIVNIETGEVFFNSNPTVDLDCDAESIYTYSPPSSCYEFTLHDAVSDGLLNGPVNPSTHACQTEHPDTARGAILLTNELGDTLFDNNNFGFSAKVIISVDRSTSTNSILENLPFNIFPNPSADYLDITFDKWKTNPFKIRILDLNGRQVFQQASSSSNMLLSDYLRLDISIIPKGVYFLEISNMENISTQKFIKI